MHTSRSKRPVALVVALIVGFGSLIAPAAAKNGNSRHKDPRGDTANAFTDIRKVGSSERNGKLRFFVKVDDANDATLPLTQIYIQSKGRAYLADSSQVIGLGKAAATSGNKKKVRSKRRGDRVILEIDPAAIRDPKKFKYSATVGGNDTSPLEFDQAPDNGGLIKVKR